MWAPGPNVPSHGKSLKISPYNTWVFMGKLSSRIPRSNTINFMGTLLGVHPIVPRRFSSSTFLEGVPCWGALDNLTWIPAYPKSLVFQGS